MASAEAGFRVFVMGLGFGKKGLENWLGTRKKEGNRKNNVHYALEYPAEYSKKGKLSVNEFTRVNDVKDGIPTEKG